MPEHHQLPRRFTFLQCVIIFWHLHTPTVVGNHDTWLNDHLSPFQQKRTSGQQGEADPYKGWFFWMFLNRCNQVEMKDYFALQRWSPSDPGKLPHSERWFGSRLAAWGWNRSTRRQPKLLEDFFEFLWKIFEDSNCSLGSDDPEMFHYINVPGWAFLPMSAYHQVTFHNLERQANALLGGTRPFSSLVTGPPSRLVGTSSQSPGPSPPVVDHRPLERLPRTFTEPSSLTNAPSPQPKSHNPVLHSPRPGAVGTKTEVVSIAVDRSDRPVNPSQDTNHRRTPTNQVAPSKLAARISIPSAIAKGNSTSLDFTSRLGKGSAKRMQSGHGSNGSPSSDYHHGSSQPKASEFSERLSQFNQGSPGEEVVSSTTNADQQSSSGQWIKQTYGVDRPPPPLGLRKGISHTSHQSLGLNISTQPPRKVAMMGTKQFKARAPSYSPPHPQEQLLNHRRSQNISPMTAGLRPPQQSQPEEAHDDGPSEMVSTPKHQRLGAFGSPSIDSSIASSPIMRSPYEPASSQTSMTSTTILQLSLESSPPQSHQSIHGKKRSSLDIDRNVDDFRSPKRTSVMSPSSVIEAVKGRLADEMGQRRPEPDRSSRHAPLVQDTTPFQPVPNTDKAKKSNNVEDIQNSASDSYNAVQVNEADTIDTLLKASKSISDCGSNLSSTDEESDEEWFDLDTDAKNHDICRSFGPLGR
ncbi:hypothetical protein N431DRAFT_468763 [Stipitochalara longipes BDJ]|nr:hypothetical protein N431DRAFT_468763 [Stipitochalara longipes BDJ]